MNTLPENLMNKIIMLNRHPLAEIFYDLYAPYREAMQIQQYSSDKAFREAGIPSFWDYKRHGLHTEERDDIFLRRWEIEQDYAWLDLDFDFDFYRHNYGSEAMPRVYETMCQLKYWREERDLLELFIYRDTSI